MKRFLHSLLITSAFVFTLSINAVQIEFHTFENAESEQLYLDLVAELRCVKCQNQNLAESNAELARDMREKTYEMISSGKSRNDVINYMTARYGDFVLYKPPFKTKTILLWVGPPILLFLSLFFIFKIIRRQNSEQTEQMSEMDLKSVRDMLGSNTNKEK